MPYPFSLPTTAPLAFPPHLQCQSHPSLPFKATITRNTLTAALQAHSRLTSVEQSSHLSTLSSCLQAYVPILLALAKGLSSSPNVADEEIDVILLKEVQTKWRPTLSRPRLTEKKVSKVNMMGLDAEIAFVLSTWAAIDCLKARTHIRTLFGLGAQDAAGSQDQRIASITAAMKCLLNASSIYTHLSKLASGAPQQGIPLDITGSTLSVLASSTLSEATLLAVLKDDPYHHLSVVMASAGNTDWMIGTPKIPKVRCHLLARICIAASEQATRARAEAQSASSEEYEGSRRGLVEDFSKYLRNQTRVARAKACRFLAVDADAEGNTGKAIAWLRAGLHELGQSRSDSSSTDGPADSKRKAFADKLKKDWKQRREDKRLERDVEWGADAGCLEEGRIIEMLLIKWEKINSTMNVQLVPPEMQLLSQLPTGRDCHTLRDWPVPELDAHTLASMRGPPDDEESTFAQVDEKEDSEAEEEDATVSSPRVQPSEVDSQYY